MLELTKIKFYFDILITLLHVILELHYKCLFLYLFSLYVSTFTHYKHKTSTHLIYCCWVRCQPLVRGRTSRDQTACCRPALSAQTRDLKGVSPLLKLSTLQACRTSPARKLFWFLKFLNLSSFEHEHLCVLIESYKIYCLKKLILRQVLKI